MNGHKPIFHWAFWFLFVVFIFSILAYLFWFGPIGDDFRSTYPDSWLVRKLSINGADWGTFGDFLGGFLNPIIAGVTLWVVIKDSAIAREQALESVVEKRKALELQRENLKIQERISASQIEAANTNWLATVSRKAYAEYESYLRRDEILWGQLAKLDDAEMKIKAERINVMIEANKKPLCAARENVERYEKMLLDIKK